MKPFIISFLLLCSIQVFSQSTSIPTNASKMQNPFKGDETVTKYAQKAYMKYCWICHGDEGKGDGPGSAALTTKPADFNSDQVLNRTDGELMWWIQHGGENMQPFADLLSKEDTWKMVNYIRKLQSE
jgi:mono/diheme cytochrome c family protein